MTKRLSGGGKLGEEAGCEILPSGGRILDCSYFFPSFLCICVFKKLFDFTFNHEATPKRPFAPV